MKNKPQIIAIIEVKQKNCDSHIESELHIPGYNVFCDLGENKHGHSLHGSAELL